MKKYEIGYGFINNYGGCNVETSEEYNSLEEAKEIFEKEKKDIDENSTYKYLSLDENIYEGNEVIDCIHLDEFRYE